MCARVHGTFRGRSPSLRRAGTRAVIGWIQNLSSDLKAGVLLGRRWLIRGFPVCRAGSGTVTPGQLEGNHVPSREKAQKWDISCNWHGSSFATQGSLNVVLGVWKLLVLRPRTRAHPHTCYREDQGCGAERTLCACHTRAPIARPHALSEFTSISTHIVFF